MSEAIIKEYCRLVSEDREACLDLFDERSLYVTRIGKEPVEMLGRSRIQPFLMSFPGFLKFEMVEYKDLGGEMHQAIIRVVGVRRPDDTIKVQVVEGRFRHFEVLEKEK